MKLRVVTNSEMKTGDRIGRWTIVAGPVRHETRREAMFDCVCTCGTSRRVPAQRLKSGGSASCGCLSAELSGHRKTRLVHGHATEEHGRSAEYHTWSSMHSRCCNPEHSSYSQYGGMGVTICERWSSFEAFIADMGHRPAGHTLDRIDSAKGYEPGNCRWATSVEQATNRRTTVLVEHNGQRKSVSQWARDAGLEPTVLHQRIKLRWDMARALSQPLRGEGRAS